MSDRGRITQNEWVELASVALVAAKGMLRVAATKCPDDATVLNTSADYIESILDQRPRIKD